MKKRKRQDMSEGGVAAPRRGFERRVSGWVNAGSPSRLSSHSGSYLPTHQTPTMIEVISPTAANNSHINGVGAGLRSDQPSPPPKNEPTRCDTTNTYQYLQWQELYETEKPFQILLDIPEDSPEQRRHNLVFEDGPVETVHDVRGRESEYSLDKNGFTYIKRASNMAPDDFTNRDKVTNVFLPELEAMLKETLDDVDQVFIYDYRRRQTGDHPLHGKTVDFNDKLTPLGPATQVHLDQSPKSVVQRVLQFLPDQASHLLRGRVQLINMWRPTNGPVEDWPLSVCDATTLPEEQLVECDRIRRAFLGCTMYVKYVEGIKWHYMSRQDNDDLLVFKTFDSDSDVPARYSVHGAFSWKEAPDPPKPRCSIEVRALVFTYPETLERKKN
ncbi:hypothetical protein QBC34DRAFT_389712 [Podospora aff. communis PSN243]|uniref:Methyltransferase n=1 Tax=Podospora aff. communis PSN243 TaxID=3040156 RepID=A0AAV9H369_9PEZI|nr:hypothetical protein QBC34DRAFT_389712 [Podospora aff. communis PSN243]